MRTLAFQSYRTHDVPRAIERSMASVRDWALARGHDYRFLDDRFFDVLPRWYRERAGDHKLLLANLARLIVARDAIAEGYDRAIWLDADVVVFDASAFDVATGDGFAWCRETWVERVGEAFVPRRRVNNAVCAFDRGNRFLDFAIWAHEALLRERPDRVALLGTSTVLLTALHGATPLPLVDGVGIFTPAMVLELAGQGEGPAVRAFARLHAHPIHAANLAWSLVGVPHDDVVATAGEYDAAVERVIATRGAAFGGRAGQGASAGSPAQSRGTR